MIEELMRETFARHEALAPAPEPVRVRIEAVATRRRRWRRGTVAVGGTLVALLALVGALAIRPDALSTGPVVGASTSAAATAAARGPMTFLIIGTDKRTFDTPDLLRSDSIMLMHLPAGGTTPYLISIPRDEKITFRGVTDKLNWVFATYGAAGLSEAVQQKTGIPIDGAVEVDFAGLIAVTDAVGGVDLCVDRRVQSTHTRQVYEPGCRRFSGADAMDYLRQRNSFPNGDYDRQKNGRQYVKALYKRLAGADLQQIMRVTAAAGSALRIDLRGYELAKLLALANSIDANSVVSIAPPATFDGLKPEAQQLWDAVRGGSLTDWVVANPQQVDQR